MAERRTIRLGPGRGTAPTSSSSPTSPRSIMRPFSPCRSLFGPTAVGGAGRAGTARVGFFQPEDATAMEAIAFQLAGYHRARAAAEFALGRTTRHGGRGTLHPRGPRARPASPTASSPSSAGRRPDFVALAANEEYTHATEADFARAVETAERQIAELEAYMESQQADVAGHAHLQRPSGHACGRLLHRRNGPRGAGGNPAGRSHRRGRRTLRRAVLAQHPAPIPREGPGRGGSGASACCAISSRGARRATTAAAS